MFFSPVLFLRNILHSPSGRFSVSRNETKTQLSRFVSIFWRIDSWAKPMTRAPRQLLTGWVAHSRPNGCPEMTWGRTLKKALKCKGLPVNFKVWRAIAEDRSEWRSRTYSRPTPPSENWSYRVHESKDVHCISQKDTQPSQTCSGGFINT